MTPVPQALPPGRPHPLGATPRPEGVQFALVSRHAQAVQLCVFDEAGRETNRYALVARDGDVWHGLLPGAKAGLVYGYRVSGPYAPQDGHRFNPNKLLLDPYAREIVGRYRGEAASNGHDAATGAADPRDNAAVALKARVCEELPTAAAVATVRVPRADMVIYEAHVRSMTARHPGVPAALRGSYAGLAEPAVLDHLQRLGVTSVSLLPVQARVDEPRLLQLGLSNHWGYNTIGFFAPEPRYWSGRPGTTPAGEFRAMVRALQARGLEVLLDVVYNHSGEGDEAGPTLSLRGLDNALYYRLLPGDRARYQNHAGCGNTLDLSQPHVLQLVMDSLRHWVQAMGVDGFRFDLVPALVRGAEGFDRPSAFLEAVHQDPVLQGCKLIAEPWDIGPGGYRLGRFPPAWQEWNDRYRDAMRRAWLHAATPGAIDRADFARRLAGSSDVFHTLGRRPWASVNFICAHDGFTLHDLVSHNHKHNERNGEHNRDGHSHNHSWNCGHEGEGGSAAVQALRERLKRALLATLMLSQGTPMLLAGDEIGLSQQGNNNAYCQDNEISWLDWPRADTDLARFVAGLVRLRRALGAAHRARWYEGGNQGGTRDGAPPVARDGLDAACADTPDIHWLRPDGLPLSPADWHGAEAALMVHLTGCADPDPALVAADAEPTAWLLLFNPTPAPVTFALPPPRTAESAWGLVLDSAAGETPERVTTRLQRTIDAPARGVIALCSRQGPVDVSP